jgi:ubiquitin-protein ligase
MDRLKLDYLELERAPLEGVSNLNLTGQTVTADLKGPEGSVYEGCTFRVKIVDTGYPFCAPKITFETPIFHPNVVPPGNWVDIEMFKSEWVPEIKLSGIFVILVANPISRRWISSTDPGP